MLTDAFLVRRLGAELDARFAGSKVRDVGELPDGRFALQLWQRGRTELLCVDVFAATPAVTVEDGDLPIGVEPGFVRAAGAALRGMTLTAVRARKGDRILRFEFGSRSRFGVESGYSLICELVPRFGNIVLLKDGTVVAAAKEFAPAENAVRSVQAGERYEPPPRRPGKSSPLIDEPTAVRLEEEFPNADLHVYRRNGMLVQAHVVELSQFADLEHERASSLVDLLAESRRGDAETAQSDRVAKRRRELERRLRDRERKLQSELAQVEGGLHEAALRDTLREQGETIFSTLHELPERERTDAKDRAAKLFARYKKAGNSVAHLERRREIVRAALNDIAELRWEVDRAADDDLEEVARAVSDGDAKPAPSTRAVGRKRRPLQYLTPSGSRIFVGRTPIENADLTFRVARPDDLWFHVQNQPSAHVILQRDDRAAPPQDDLAAAASLAALHSKAKASPHVTVDYTLRKHVRKRPAAAPGLVFYTNPKSLRVEPHEPQELKRVP